MEHYTLVGGGGGVQNNKPHSLKLQDRDSSVSIVTIYNSIGWAVGTVSRQATKSRSAMERMECQSECVELYLQSPKHLHGMT
jgi:hypothetical protein